MYRALGLTSSSEVTYFKVVESVMGFLDRVLEERSTTAQFTVGSHLKAGLGPYTANHPCAV
jgi:hypothetical protein